MEKVVFKKLTQAECKKLTDSKLDLGSFSRKNTENTAKKCMTPCRECEMRTYMCFLLYISFHSVPSFRRFCRGKVHLHNRGSDQSHQSPRPAR